jgi:hypothetical protein
MAQNGEHVHGSGPERLVLDGSMEINWLGQGGNGKTLEDDD